MNNDKQHIEGRDYRKGWTLCGLKYDPHLPSAKPCLSCLRVEKSDIRGQITEKVFELGWVERQIGKEIARREADV